MGIFSVNVSTVSRAACRRAVAAAAYCSRSKVYDEDLGRDVDFSEKNDGVHSEILTPRGAPGRWAERWVLWNEIESVEEREDAQLAREIELVISRELGLDDAVALCREFFVEQFVERGMIVDLNIHRARSADGSKGLYVHGLFSMREIVGDGFGKKRTDWKETKLLLKWRERWSELSNRHLLAMRGEGTVGSLVSARPDAARGRGLEAPLEAGVCGVENFEIAWRNGERMLAEPGHALKAFAREQAIFSRVDLSAFVRRNTASEAQYEKALARLEASVDLVRLGGGEMLAMRGLAGADEASNGAGYSSDRDLSLEEAMALWGNAGLRVRGVGLTYDLAQAFEKRTGIKTSGMHGLLGRWKKKQDLLTADDVLVISGVLQMSPKQREWMLRGARAARAKLAVIEGAGVVVIDGTSVGLDARQAAALRC